MLVAFFQCDWHFHFKIYSFTFHLKDFASKCYKILNESYFWLNVSSPHHLFIYFWPCQVTCGILVFQQGIKPALGGQSPNNCTTRKVPIPNIFKKKNYLFLIERCLLLQYCVGFCETSTWISPRYTCVSFLLSLPPTSLPTHYLPDVHSVSTDMISMTNYIF